MLILVPIRFHSDYCNSLSTEFLTHSCLIHSPGSGKNNVFIDSSHHVTVLLKSFQGFLPLVNHCPSYCGLQCGQGLAPAYFTNPTYCLTPIWSQLSSHTSHLSEPQTHWAGFFFFFFKFPSSWLLCITWRILSTGHLATSTINSLAFSLNVSSLRKISLPISSKIGSCSLFSLAIIKNSLYLMQPDKAFIQLTFIY